MGTPPDFDMSASEGGYPFPVTFPKKRLPTCGRTPDCVEELIANGQQSTDSFDATSSIFEKAGFGCLTILTGRVAVSDGRQREIASHLPKASPVATALVAVSVGEGRSIGYADEGRLRKLGKPVALLALATAQAPTLRRMPPGLPPSPSRPKVNPP